LDPKEIWRNRPEIEVLNALHENTAVDRLGIEIMAVGPDYLEGRMPVDHRTLQPFGLLHGGASVLLLETLASAAGNHCIDQATQLCVGLAINCNHLRAVREGFVRGRAEAIHVGRRSMVWGLNLYDEQERLVCNGRMTAAVVEH
jgi:1,4-dihydroxy-2-naphthoyl-CoA hydrolase